jgi:hypothetical protein
MPQRIKSFIPPLVAVLFAEAVAAQVLQGPGSSGAAPMPPGQVQQRRDDVRQAVAAQRTAVEHGEIKERRLSPQEKAELRQQVRLQGQASGSQGR